MALATLYEFEENAFNINLPGTITNVQATTSSGTISAQLVDASSDQTSSFPFEFNQHVNEIDVDYDIEITVIYNDDSIVKSSTFLIDPRSILTTSGINPSSSSSSQPTSGVQLDIVGIYAKNAINNISIVNENDVPLESYITELNNYDGIYAKITLDKFTPDGTYTITSSTSTGTTSSTSYTVNFGDTSSISLPTETIQVSRPSQTRAPVDPLLLQQTTCLPPPEPLPSFDLASSSMRLSSSSASLSVRPMKHFTTKVYGRIWPALRAGT